MGLVAVLLGCLGWPSSASGAEDDPGTRALRSILEDLGSEPEAAATPLTGQDDPERIQADKLPDEARAEILGQDSLDVEGPTAGGMASRGAEAPVSSSTPDTAGPKTAGPTAGTADNLSVQVDPLPDVDDGSQQSEALAVALQAAVVDHRPESLRPGSERPEESARTAAPGAGGDAHGKGIPAGDGSEGSLGTSNGASSWLPPIPPGLGLGARVEGQSNPEAERINVARGRFRAFAPRFEGTGLAQAASASESTAPGGVQAARKAFEPSPPVNPLASGEALAYHYLNLEEVPALPFYAGSGERSGLPFPVLDVSYGPLEYRHSFGRTVRYGPSAVTVIRNPEATYAALEVRSTDNILKGLGAYDRYRESGSPALWKLYGWRPKLGGRDLFSLAGIHSGARIRPSWEGAEAPSGYLRVSEPMRLRVAAGLPEVNRGVPVPWTESADLEELEEEELHDVPAFQISQKAAVTEEPEEKEKPIYDPQLQQAEYYGNVAGVTEEILYFFEQPLDSSPGGREGTAVVPFTVPAEPPLETEGGGRSRAVFERIEK